MTEIIVKTQAELDAALANPTATTIIINSPRGVWLTLDRNDAAVKASGSATVAASGSATVRASDSATVRASDSATVRASDSATVRAWDSATVEASGSATVEASGSATVKASDSATVKASGSATVKAWGSATVRASGSATVRAAPYVAVHLFSAHATVTGGVVIDIAALNLDNPETWCAYHGIEVTDGVATVYKAVDDRYFSTHGTCYKPGATPDAPDWQPTKICGQGLHFSPTPRQAQSYNHATAAAAKYVACGVAVAGLIPLDSDKCKAPRVVRSCAEVDIDGQPLTTPKASLS